MNCNVLAEEIQQILIQRGQTLSTAESCTSGRIAAQLTRISGASSYFQGGLVAYQDELKIRFLGVDPECIRQHDVVSQPVVEQMVRGACRLFHTRYALASTGYAGTSSNPHIPSGTIWIAWGGEESVSSLCLTQDKDREWNTQNAVFEVLSHFLTSLKEAENEKIFASS